MSGVIIGWLNTICHIAVSTVKRHQRAALYCFGVGKTHTLSGLCAHCFTGALADVVINNRAGVGRQTGDTVVVVVIILDSS